MFENPAPAEIAAFLRRIRTIAILGLSETPDRPSHHVAHELQKFGYRIVPVNPTATEILGERAWPDLPSALWLQEGVIDEVAAQKARDAGLFTVMNRCMFKERLKISAG